MALGKTLGKVPVLAGNCDGFIGNRMLGFYGLEAEFLLEEGATPQQIDRVIEGFGFAMGPLAVRDLAGNDVGLDDPQGPQAARRRALVADPRAAGERGASRTEERARASTATRAAAAFPDPEVLTIIEDVSDELGITRREIPDEEILDAPAAPAGERRRAHRGGGHRDCVPGMSTSCTSTATVFRPGAAARCTGPSKQALSTSWRP